MLHLQASGQRFLTTSGRVVSFYDVTQIIRKQRPEKATRLAALKPTPAEFYKKISTKKQTF